MGTGTEAARPDFRKVFRAAPALLLLVDRDFRVVDASDAFLGATRQFREAIRDRSIFEVYPPSAGEAGADAPLRLLQSLERVLRHDQVDHMDFQRFDVPRPGDQGGGLEERYWSPSNAPVHGPDGRVEQILHRVEDVTEFVLARRSGHRWERVRESMRVRGEGMEAEIFLKANRLADSNHRQSESAARLAASIFHEFNDILTALAGYADLALTLPLAGDARAYLREIQAAGERAAVTARRLRSLAGPGPGSGLLKERPATATGPRPG